MAQTNQASGMFTVVQIIDGDSIQGGLVASQSLSQMYNASSGTCVPNWTGAATADKPVVYPVIYMASQGGSVGKVPSAYTWYYNGTAITFGSGTNPTSTNFSGAFQRVDSYNNGTVNVQALRIVKNLATASNTDDDIIRLEATVETNGQSVTFAAETNVRLSEMTSAGYAGGIHSIDLDNGNIPTAQFDNDTNNIRLTATLYGSDGAVRTSGVSYQWYKNGTVLSGKTARTLDIVKDDVDSHATYSCAMSVSSEVVYTAYHEIFDLTDPYAIAFAWTSGPQVAVGVNVSGTCKLMKMAGGTQVTTGVTWSYQLYDAAGSSLSNTASGISLNTSTGAMSFTSAAIAAAGGKITGYVTALVA